MFSVFNIFDKVNIFEIYIIFDKVDYILDTLCIFTHAHLFGSIFSVFTAAFLSRLQCVKRRGEHKYIFTQTGIIPEVNLWHEKSLSNNVDSTSRFTSLGRSIRLLSDDPLFFVFEYIYRYIVGSQQNSLVFEYRLFRTI